MKIAVKNRAGSKVLPDGILVKDVRVLAMSNSAISNSQAFSLTCSFGFSLQDATVKDLKAQMHALKPKLYPARQRWTVPVDSNSSSSAKPFVLSKDTQLLADLGIKSGSTLIFKDLGPQIGYQTVFFWEYLGPLVIYLMMYLLPASLLYGSHSKSSSTSSIFSSSRSTMHYDSTKSLTQTLACVYWTAHYAKRIYETFFVHKFSHATMPLFNLIKNCTYYWMFAAYVAYFVNHPLYTAPAFSQTVVALTVALVCQLANYKCHVILANLRPPGSSDYVIPKGFLFEWITCPNYTAEICGWIAFSVATQCGAAGIFTAVGAGQMAQWALGKHARLRRTFNGKDGKEKYPRRWVVMPGLL
jgi:very-long-chain enoyl-CoA reductase